ncbi:CRP-like cAMP-binding protein [Bradyrhizobium sp. AZCC 1577]
MEKRWLPLSRALAVRRHGVSGNRLLAALPPADFDLLVPEPEMIALDQDAVLSRDAIEYVFFPHSGAMSLMVDMADGKTVATAANGREGAVGILSVLGPSASATTTIVRAAGTASRIPAPRFHAAFNRSPAIRHAVQSHVRAMLIQFQLGAACNALHPVEARIAPLAAPFSRPHGPRRPPADPGDAVGNTRCATNDGDAPDTQSARVRSDQI